MDILIKNDSIAGNPSLTTIYTPLLTSIICNNTMRTTIFQTLLNTGLCHTVCLQCSPRQRIEFYMITNIR